MLHLAAASRFRVSEAASTASTASTQNASASDEMTVPSGASAMITAAATTRLRLTLWIIRSRNSVWPARYSTGPKTSTASSTPVAVAPGWAITSSSPTATTMMPATIGTCR